MTVDERMASVHILDIDGGVASAGMAIIGIAARLRTFGPMIARIVRLGPIKLPIEVAYRAIARNRHHLARFVEDVEPVVRWRSQP